MDERDGTAELARVLDAVGVSRLEDTGWIRVTGSDAVRWLNGMVTNSIQELKAGEGNYSFALNAQGRIQGDLVCFAEGDGTLWLETERARVTSMMAMFDRFIIMDDVELEDRSAGRAGWALAGPRAGEVLHGLGITAGLAISRQAAVVNGAAVEVIAGWGPVVARYEIWGAEQDAARIKTALAGAAEKAGGGMVGTAAMEWLRMLEGTPRYGVDIRDKELPQETGQTRALHFAKGCYLGQEIVERIRSRGNVHRGFGAFHLEGQLPAPGTAFEAEGKVIGELTSVAAVPMPGGPMQLGLGYVRREAVDRGLALTYAGGTAAAVASPVVVPAAFG